MEEKKEVVRLEKVLMVYCEREKNGETFTCTALQAKEYGKLSPDELLRVELPPVEKFDLGGCSGVDVLIDRNTVRLDTGWTLFPTEEITESHTMKVAVHIPSRTLRARNEFDYPCG